MVDGLAARPRAVGRGAVALAVALIGAAWVRAGVSPLEMAAFGGYELLALLLPGVLVYRALSERPGGLLRHVGIGWALGHVVELAMFMAFAELGLRSLLPVGIGVTAAVAGTAAVRRHGWPTRVSTPRVAWSAGAAWLAVVCLVVAGYVTVGSLTQSPLPSSADSVAYYQDELFELSVAAEAKHHWPVSTPQIAGTPLRYHTFAFMHWAAASSISGVELPAIALQLDLIALLALLIAQLILLGRALTGRTAAGVGAVALLLIVGDLDLGVDRPAPLLGQFLSNTYLSHSFVFGLVLFVPAALLACELLSGRGRRGHWTMLALLLLASSGAKASILPVVAGGSLLFLAWEWIAERRVDRVALALLGLTGVILLATTALLYRGADGAIDIAPLQGGEVFRVGALFAPPGESASLLRHLAAELATTAAFLLPLAGLAWLGRRPDRVTRPQAWAISLLLASLIAFLALRHPGGSQLYFLWYGVVAAAPLAAAATLDLIARARAEGLRSPALAGGLATTAVVFLLAPAVLDGAGPARVLALALVAALAAVAWIAARGGRNTTVLATALTLGLLGVAAIDPAIDRFPGFADRLVTAGVPLHQPSRPEGPRGVTRDLEAALSWVRDRTPDSAILAVNNQTRFPGRDPRYFYYSALAERRVVLEGWVYAGLAEGADSDGLIAGSTQPFPDRARLVAEAVEGDCKARARLHARYGVTHLLFDLLHGPPPPAGLGEPVFSNAAAEVFRVGAGCRRA